MNIKLIPFLFAMPLLAGGGINQEPLAACTVSMPWGEYSSGTLICFKGDPRAPYAVFRPENGSSASRVGDVWVVQYQTPQGDAMYYITVPAADCIQVVNPNC